MDAYHFCLNRRVSIKHHTENNKILKKKIFTNLSMTHFFLATKAQYCTFSEQHIKMSYISAIFAPEDGRDWVANGNALQRHGAPPGDDLVLWPHHEWRSSWKANIHNHVSMIISLQ